MAKNENKILEELRRRGKIYEDPAPKVGGFYWLVNKLVYQEKVSLIYFFLDVLSPFDISI